MSQKWVTLGLLAVAELLAMSLWFSASAVTPVLMDEWSLTAGQAAWLTMTVQIGFVVGAVLSAMFNVADILPPRVVFGTGAVMGAVLNAAIPIWSTAFSQVLILRFGTGVCLAAVYPVGMKIMATWTREDRGLGIGLLVGALTLGSASPHLMRGLGGIEDWKFVMMASSSIAATGGMLVLAFGDLGPYRAAPPKFKWGYLARALTDRPLRLANLGYLGHMWELYAMWTWIPLFLAYAYTQSPAESWAAGDPERFASLAAFAIIGVGGVGSVLAGKLSDSWGRGRTTILSMGISGICAATIGVFGVGHATLVTLMGLVWGFSIVADSAQFSSAVSELCEPEYMGTLLTAQTAMGFLLTLPVIRAIPILVESVGWEWAFTGLTFGPFFGIIAMKRLTTLPESSRLAGGRG